MILYANRLLFGPAGVPSGIEQTSTLDGIQHAAKLGLDCFEIEFVKGYRMGSDTAGRIKEKAQELKIPLSVHAPYYVNLSSPEEGKRLASQDMILRSAILAEKCGAECVVFHPGYYGKRSPDDAFESIKKGLAEVVSILRKERSEVMLRPETMGKKSQFGTLEEILLLCREVEGIQPCIDFAHIHSREGRANSYREFYSILRKIEKKLGAQALKTMHIHISGVEYNKNGEIRHLNLKGSDFRYDDWIQALRDFDICGRIICESPDQTTDALMLMKMYKLGVNSSEE